MKLEQLMEGVPYTLVQGSPETEINDIIYDSRKAAPGLLFVCIVGTQRDSHEFAADCAAKGVSALVIQHDIDLTAVPGALYLLLVLHYIEQECIAESSAVARPHNKTVERICAYLAANYRQKFSLSEVAARFYLSPYYLSRLFKRVTGQSIVDYINNRRIEAAQKLLETTELSISAVAEQTGFASAAHFRRVFHEVMGTGPLQYRKAHKK